MKTQERVEEAAIGSLSLGNLERQERQAKSRFTQHLKTDEWINTFRGRDVLRQFVDRHVGRVKYEVFRDLILSRMTNAGFQPQGMRQVIESILNA